jgi:hypothetical protein
MSATAKSAFGESNVSGTPEPSASSRRQSTRTSSRASFGHSLLGRDRRESSGTATTNIIDPRMDRDRRANTHTQAILEGQEGIGGGGGGAGVGSGIASGIRERYGLGERGTSGGSADRDRASGGAYLSSRYGSPSLGAAAAGPGRNRDGSGNGSGPSGSASRKKYHPQGGVGSGSNTHTVANNTRMEQHFNNSYSNSGMYSGGTSGSGSGGKLSRPFKDERHYQSREGGIDKTKLRICVRIRPSDKKLNHSSGQSVKSSKEDKRCIQLSNRNPKRITVVGSKTAMEDSGHDFAVFEFDKVSI